MSFQIPDLAVKIQPLGSRVLVAPQEMEIITSFGLIIPETAKGKEKPQQGVVIALGKGEIGKDSVDPSKYLKVGDLVLFSMWSGDNVKVKDSENKDVEVKLIQLEQILGIVKQ